MAPVRSHLTPVRWQRAGEDVDKLESSCAVAGDGEWGTCRGRGVAAPQTFRQKERAVPQPHVWAHVCREWTQGPEQAFAPRVHGGSVHKRPKPEATQVPVSRGTTGTRDVVRVRGGGAVSPERKDVPHTLRRARTGRTWRCVWSAGHQSVTQLDATSRGPCRSHVQGHRGRAVGAQGWQRAAGLGFHTSLFLGPGCPPFGTTDNTRGSLLLQPRQSWAPGLGRALC